MVMDSDFLNTWVIVQSRMRSSRLPGKVMRKINGIPIAGIQLNRIKTSGYRIAVATSACKENDELCEYVGSLGIPVFRGSEENVLERFYQAGQYFQADMVIRITGDNPLIDGVYVNQVMDSIKDYHPRLYMSPGLSKTWPVGSSFEAFSFGLLEEAYLNGHSQAEKEHVTPYIRYNFPGDIDVRTFNHTENHSNIRLTVDTESDFELMKMLIEDYGCDRKSIFEIIDLFSKHPQLLKINGGIIQKKWNER